MYNNILPFLYSLWVLTFPSQFFEESTQKTFEGKKAVTHTLNTNKPAKMFHGSWMIFLYQKVGKRAFLPTQ